MGVNSKDKRDIYYRMAKENNYRARSAYKLIHLNERYNFLNKQTKTVIDLCAAPGSWSQICLENLSPESKIISVDLLKIKPFYNKNKEIYKNSQLIEGDITSEGVLNLLKEYEVDMLLCDGAPDITGIKEFDEYYQNQLVLNALNIFTKLKVKADSFFISKIFRGSETFFIKKHLEKFFKKVELVKPLSSRNASIESFFVCEGYLNDENMRNKAFEVDLDIEIGGVELEVCGSGPDPDTVSENPNESIKHQYPPINAAYVDIIQKRKQ